MYIEWYERTVHIPDLSIAKVIALQHSNKRVKDIFYISFGIEADNPKKL